jgi:lysophospholipase L1-like esterase
MTSGAMLLFAAWTAAMSADRTARAAGDSIAFLALGDSYTIGEGVAEADRWPMALARALRAGGVPVADPRIIARTGWTVDELDAAITRADPPATFGLVTLLIGVNNQYRGRDVGLYRAEFRAQLRRAIGFASGRADRVLVVSIPDWGVMPFAEGRDRAAIARAIDAYNAANREESAALGVAWVDITDLSRARATDAGFAAADGLHPGAAQYAAWVERILPVARRLLAP